MNGYNIYDKACIRLGYKGTGNNEILDSRIVGRALEFVNQISIDLKLGGVENLSDKIICSEEHSEALCCGVAMLISMAEGDLNKNVIFTALYNAKRAATLGGIGYVIDKLPVAEG